MPKVPCGKETARRLTETAGGALWRGEEGAVERLEREAPPPLPGPAVLPLRVDGALVPLVQGEWAEVKTLALGGVQPGQDRKGQPVVHTTQLSSCSRLAEA